MNRKRLCASYIYQKLQSIIMIITQIKLFLPQEIYAPYVRNYKLRLVYFLPYFWRPNLRFSFTKKSPQQDLISKTLASRAEEQFWKLDKSILHRYLFRDLFSSNCTRVQCNGLKLRFWRWISTWPHRAALRYKLGNLKQGPAEGPNFFWAWTIWFSEFMPLSNWTKLWKWIFYHHF